MFAELIVLQKFDCDIAEGSVGHIAREMCKGSGAEVDVSVVEGECGWRLSFYFVDDLCVADEDEGIVVAVPVREGRLVLGDRDVVDADLVVGENFAVMRFGGDLDFFGRLGGEDGWEE